jgi:hypothetical protein
MAVLCYFSIKTSIRAISSTNLKNQPEIDEYRLEHYATQGYHFEFIAFVNTNMTYARTREAGETIVAMNLKQDRTAHLSHWGSTLRD